MMCLFNIYFSIFAKIMVKKMVPAGTYLNIRC